MADLGRVAITPADEFVEGKQYERLDMVTYGSGVYVAKEDNINILPTEPTVWMKMGEFATIGIMTSSRNGIGRPDNDTVKVNANGVFYSTCVLEKVYVIPTAENAVKNTIYLIEDNTSTGVNPYRMYTLIGGEVVCINDISTDLSDYVLVTDFREHTDSSVVSADGVHDIRYYEGKFQGYDSDKAEWFDIATGGSGGGVDIGDVSGAAVVADRSQAKLTWSDPEDVVLSDITLAKWGGTLVVRKEGSAPTDRNDGVKVLDSKTRNAYSSTPYVDTGLEYGKTYYYRFFPYTTGGNYTDGSSVSVVPTRIVITTVPSQSGILTYNATEQEPTFADYDSSKLTLGGDTAGMNADTYTATFTPREDYEWSDGTRTAKEVTWSIGQADANVDLSDTEVTLDDDHASVVVITTNPTGTITVSSSDTNIVTAVYEDEKITIASVNEASGNVTITISIAESVDGNYASGTKTISVSAEYLKIVSWSTGTDKQIATLVQAANEGIVDLYEDAGWRVGDVRQVQLSAMPATNVGESHVAEEVTLVISQFGGYQVVDDEYKECILQVDMVNTLTADGYMNDTNTNTGSWESSKRRAWCDNEFYNALPTDLKPIFEQFVTITAKTYNGTELQESNDYSALRAEKEIFGSATYSNATEAAALSQIEYYKTTSNRIKKLGDNGSTNNYWWLRSPYSGNTAYFCNVNNSGGANRGNASNTSGVSSFLCIGKIAKEPKPVQWATGTDEEIADLIKASRLGLIDLYEDCGWRVGDTRQVTLSAMPATNVGESHVAETVTFVLSERGGYEYVNPVKNKDGSDRIECAFQVDMVNCLAVAGYMNNTNINTGSWNNSKRRLWCNNEFFNALPTALQSAFGWAFKTITAETYNGTTNQTSNDFFALRAEKEIFGSATYSNATEAAALSQIEYYKTTSNRIKKLGDNGSTNNYWWLRSPFSSNTAHFCLVGNSGIADSNFAGYARGVSSFGCIG